MNDTNVTPATEAPDDNAPITSEAPETTATETKIEAKRLGEQDFDSIVTVKINGETKEMPLREVIKLNQLENASHAKMQEAAKLMKQVQGVIHMAKTDPKAFLRETGMDPYDFAEATLAEKFKLMQMTPEQKQLLEYEQKVKHYEEKENELKKNYEMAEMTRVEAQEMSRLDTEVGDAWKESGLPKTKYMFAQIAANMLSSSKQGKPLTAKEAAASVKAAFVSNTREVISQLDAEAIQEILGKDVLKKIRDWEVKRVTGKSASQGNKSTGQKPASEKPTSFKSQYEWRKHIEELASKLKD